MKNNFYVYIHKKETNNEVFYVGKGKDKRAYSKANRNKHWQYIANKHGYTIEIIKDCLCENDAFRLEIETIKFYEKDNLCNMTDGGDGVSGFVFSKESKLKMSLAKINKPSSRKGKKLSAEQIAKHSLFMKGKSFSHDKKEYHFINIHGEEFVGTRRGLYKTYGVPIGNIYEIVKNKRQLNGWAIKGYETSKNLKSFAKLGKLNPAFGKLSKRADTTIQRVIKDGNEFMGTWYEFSDKFNINRKLASAFFKGRKNSCYGWRLAPAL